jgi:hypothetical protein
MLPRNLKHLVLGIASPEKLEEIIDRVRLRGKGLHEDRGWQSITNSTPSLPLESVARKIGTLVWHLGFAKHMVMAMPDRVLDELKLSVEQHSTQGLSYRVYSRTSGGKPMPLNYLMGQAFEVQRPYYYDQLPWADFQAR